MQIIRKEDLDTIKREIPREILENPEFAFKWYQSVEKNIEEKLPFEIEISPESKKITIVHKMEVERNIEVPQGKLEIIQFQINQRGEMEYTLINGFLREASSYYRQTNTAPNPSITSFLDIDYQKTLFDRNGIEMAYGDFSDSLYGLSGISFESDLQKTFRSQLLTDGYHTPKDWNVYQNPTPPTFFTENAHVNGGSRSAESPWMATTYRYDLNPKYGNQPLNRESFLATIHDEHPEYMRIDEYEKFAKWDESGKWSLIENPLRNLEGKKIEDVKKEESLLYEEILRKKVEEELDSDIRKKYEVLLNKVADYNSKNYRDLQQVNGR